ncbi:MAG: MaoC domain protein dehydratase [Phenylobacterium sp.]|nr:MaoC domain protein dehydratase [Phenylobacterium sp.]
MIDRSTLQPGFLIPTISRPGDYQYWNRYAAVNYEFAGHHMDDAVGQYEGFEAAIGMGPFIHALMHVLLREWVGEDVGRVVKVGMQSRRPWIRGRTLTEGGKVTAVREEDGELFVSLEVWGENDKGERLVVGEAEVAVPA